MIARSFLSDWWGTGIGLPSVVVIQPDFQHQDGRSKFVTELDQQVDVVEVLLATEAVSQVVTRVDGHFHFTAIRAEKTKKTFAPFGGGPLPPQGGDRDGHRQVIANATEQFRAEHVASLDVSQR